MKEHMLKTFFMHISIWYFYYAKEFIEKSLNISKILLLVIICYLTFLVDKLSMFLYCLQEFLFRNLTQVLLNVVFLPGGSSLLWSLQYYYFYFPLLSLYCISTGKEKNINWSSMIAWSIWAEMEYDAFVSYR